MALKESFFGAVRRRTFICCRKVQISASSAARDRIRSTTVQPISLKRSLITQHHRPIRRYPPAGWFTTGTGTVGDVPLVDRSCGVDAGGGEEELRGAQAAGRGPQVQAAGAAVAVQFV